MEDILGSCPKYRLSSPNTAGDTYIRREGAAISDKRVALIQGVVRCVAQKGVGTASTRDIAEYAGVNDSHIYRFFEDRDELINTAYIETSSRVMENMINRIRALRSNNLGMSFEDCMRVVFHTAWRDLLDDPDVCRFLVYYYHSPLFMRYAYSHHTAQTERLVALTMDLFGGLQETNSVIYILVTQLYDFSMMVANGIDEDTPETEEKYFQVLAQLKAVRDRIEADKKH